MAGFGSVHVQGQRPPLRTHSAPASPNDLAMLSSLRIVGALCKSELRIKGEKKRRERGEGQVCVWGGRAAGSRVLWPPGLGLGESAARGSCQKAPCLKRLPPLIYDKPHVEPPHAGSAWLHAACWAGTLILQLLLSYQGSWPPPRHLPDSINGCKNSVISQMVRRAMHLYSGLELLLSPQTTAPSRATPRTSQQHDTDQTISQPCPAPAPSSLSISKQLEPGFGSHPRAQMNGCRVDLDSHLSSAPKAV